MAERDKEPVAATPMAAIEAFDRDLAIVLNGKNLEELEWKRPDTLTLLVPMIGGDRDRYLLRLHFGFYPEWPPSAQFVNPDTGIYDIERDLKWLPKIEGCSEIQVHPKYEYNGKKMQLICCSATLEFYQVRHSVEERHIWNIKHQNFFSTLHAVTRGLQAPFYKGPQIARE